MTNGPPATEPNVADGFSPSHGEACLVHCLCIDLEKSGQAGAAMPTEQWDRFNLSLAKYLRPVVDDLGLQDSVIKFMGDGWLVFSSDVEQVRALCCLALIVARRFQDGLSKSVDMRPEDVPPPRLSICQGRDLLVVLPDGRKDWVGDSARRATRVCICPEPKEIIVDDATRTIVSRDFHNAPVDLGKLPPDRRPKDDGEQWALHRLSGLKPEAGQGSHAPLCFVRTLELLGDTARAEALMQRATRGPKAVPTASVDSGIARRWSRLLRERAEHGDRPGAERPKAVPADPRAYPPGLQMWRQEGKLGEIIGGPGHTHPTMVWVPQGEFRVGSDGAHGNEAPAHQVTITRGFWLSRCLVTNAQYAGYLNERQREQDDAHLDSITDDNNYWREIHQEGGVWKPIGNRSQFPVVGVDWYSARAYAAWYGLRLPTEAEWEFAARGRENRVYPWGDVWDREKCCSADAPGRPWMYLDGRYHPDSARATNVPRRLMEAATHTDTVDGHPTGASWCGALDMAGNQMEWCEDVPRDYPDDGSSWVDEYEPDPTPGLVRAVKGGNCFHGQDECRASCRKNATSPDYANNSIGFRCLYAPEDQDAGG